MPSQPAPAAAASAGADSFAAFGGFADAPAPPAGASSADADFGDFGGFGEGAPAAPTAPAAPPPPSGGGMLSADMFGAPSEPAAEPAAVAAPLGAPAPPPADDDFGGFGDTSASAVDVGGSDGGFGSFGGVDAAPSQPAGGGGDAFGFGGFDAAPSPAPAPPAAGLGGGMLSADLFGGLDEAAAAPPPPAASADDGFGSFGDAGVSTGAAAAPALTVPAGAGADDFGGFGGFGGVAAAGANADAATTSGGGGDDDDFGGFGGFGGAAASAAPPPSLPMPGAGASPAFGAADDDSFGQFEAILPSGLGGGVGGAFGGSAEPSMFGSMASVATAMPVPVPVPAAMPSSASSSAPLEEAAAFAPVAAGDLAALTAALIGQERYEEALACERHAQAAGKLAGVTAEYEQAKEEDDLERALHLKKVVLPQLKADVAADHVVAGWNAASPAHRTLAQMAAAAEATLGAADAAPFVSRCCRQEEMRSLAASGRLAKAAQMQAAASATLGLLLELPPARQRQALERLAELLAAARAQANAAASALAAGPPAGVGEAEHLEALGSPKVAALLDALAELRTLGCRLASSLEWHGHVFAASASSGVAVPSAQEAREELDRHVRTAFAAARKPPKELDQESREALEEGGRLRYWGAALPAGKRCGLSLLPLRSDEFAELPPTVEWSGGRYHAPAANLWAHCVRDEAP